MRVHRQTLTQQTTLAQHRAASFQPAPALTRHRKGGQAQADRHVSVVILLQQALSSCSSAAAAAAALAALAQPRLHLAQAAPHGLHARCQAAPHLAAAAGGAASGAQVPRVCQSCIARGAAAADAASLLCHGAQRRGVARPGAALGARVLRVLRRLLLPEPHLGQALPHFVAPAALAAAALLSLLCRQSRMGPPVAAAAFLPSQERAQLRAQRRLALPSTAFSRKGALAAAAAVLVCGVAVVRGGGATAEAGDVLSHVFDAIRGRGQQRGAAACRQDGTGAGRVSSG